MIENEQAFRREVLIASSYTACVDSFYITN